jgi:predicted RNA-binding protein with RPS1 domain
MNGDNKNTQNLSLKNNSKSKQTEHNSPKNQQNHPNKRQESTRTKQFEVQLIESVPKNFEL